MPRDIGGGVTLLTRADWGANPLAITVGRVAVPTQWKRTVYHHTVIIDNDATPNLWTNIAEVKAKMRQLQVIRPDLGSEVPYSFVHFLMEGGGLVVCEGRGTRRTGAHTIGHNSTWLGVAFEGDFENFTQDIRRWIPRVNHFAWWIRKQGCRNLAEPFMVHQDTSQTACPGSEVITRRELFSYAELATVGPPPEEEEDEDMRNPLVLLHAEGNGAYYLSDWMTKRHITMAELTMFRYVQVPEAEVPVGILDAIPEVEGD